MFQALRPPSLSLSLLTGLAMLSALTQTARAGETETRSFRIVVDGKPAGSYTITVARQADGGVQVTSAAQAAVKYLGVTVYSYQLRCSETWAGGRLTRLSSAATDNGKRLRVEAQADATGIVLTADGPARRVRPDVLTTTYWRLPDPRSRTGPIVLLDADTGREIPVQVQPLGVQQLNVGGTVIPCTHYRYSGQIVVDLWYDANERLVRQETMEDGHRTGFELTGVQR